MKPLYLEFKGLNSFSEKTQIDFTPLLKGGIFGIFGETGSGKSTILDAINFALFGDIGRSTVKTDKINDKCDTLEVKFTFDIFSDGKRRKYYIERSIKKKSGTHKAMLYELPENEETGGKCLADNVKSVDNKIVEIIGINEEDFKKCIALPQGEFSKFVKSAPSERTELIERLFSLQKYGENLKFKLSRRKMQKDGEFNTITGKLSAYEGITKEKLEELEKEVEILKDSEIKLKKTYEKDSSEYQIKKKQFEDKNAYINAKTKYDSLKADKLFYDGLENSLSILPYCVTALDGKKEIVSIEKKQDFSLNEIAALKKQLSISEKNKSLLTKKIEESNYESEYKKLNELYGKMSSLLTDADKLAKISEKLSLCREKYKNQQKELAGITKSITELQYKYKSLHAKLDSMPEPDLIEYFGSELKGSILKDEYVKNLCYIKDLQDGVNFFADGSTLYDYITKELNTKADEYKQLILSLKDVKIDVYSQLQQFSINLKKHKELENEVRDCSSQIDLEKQKQITSTALLDETKAEGERLKAEYSEYTDKLTAVFGNITDYRTAAEEVAKKAESIKIKQKKDENNLKNAEKEIASYSIKIASFEQAYKSDCDRKNIVEKTVAECLEKTAVSDITECENLIKKYGNYTDALKKLNTYTAELAAAESQVKRFEKQYIDIQIDETILKSAELAKTESEHKYTEATRLRAVKESEIKAFSEQLEQKNKLDDELAVINSERNLLAQLDKLLRDNKFMKYIANEHLENISRSASKTLLELTDGRYFLKYEENNFCVGDNYNGGNLRRVNTLSGGETFLVSLSLSLALSDTICKRSLKSIEFFFLDEGFGTLDGDLIDTVLDALEKLKSSDFTIGLISHVDELKHRINNKILVSKATESHGSTVKICC